MSDYPQWIDDYACSAHKAVSHMAPADWGPLNFFDCYRELNGTFIAKLHEAVVQLKQQKVPLHRIAQALHSPSQFRAMLYFAFMEYQQCDHTQKQRAQAREVFDYFYEVLQVVFVRDVWALRENVIHTDEQIDALLQRIPFHDAAPEFARAAARLGNAAGTVSYVLFRDFYMCETFDVFAPYNVERHFGKSTTFMQRTYPLLRPTELWQESASLQYDSVNLYFVYKDLGVECELIGPHTVYKGDPIDSLYTCAVEIDGEFTDDIAVVKAAAAHIGEQVVDFWKLYDGLSQPQLQQIMLQWMCFAAKPLFDIAGADWRPTKDMQQALVGKPVRERLTLGEFMSYDAFVESKEWEVYWLKDLYKNR